MRMQAARAARIVDAHMADLHLPTRWHADRSGRGPPIMLSDADQMKAAIF
jgi:hypothetical protein